MPAKYTPEQRIAAFWEKVDKNGPIPEHRPELGPCWTWIAARLPNGYGVFKFGTGTRLAHVVAYILTTGHEPPPETPDVTHLCDAGASGCVRPSHLLADDHPGNMAQMAERGRAARGERRPESKLTEADVREIRRRWAVGGILHRELAVEFGVTRSAISNVISRKAWSHV